jgi:hypothetical protein
MRYDVARVAGVVVVVAVGFILVGCGWFEHAGHRGSDASSGPTDPARRRDTGGEYYRDG